MKKNALKINHLFVGGNVRREIKVGQIDIVIGYRFDLYRNKEDKVVVSVDDWWEESITYMDIKITKWDDMKKFKTFHKEMGVDLDTYIDEPISNEEIEKLIKKQFGNQLHDLIK